MKQCTSVATFATFAVAKSNVFYYITALLTDVEFSHHAEINSQSGVESGYTTQQGFCSLSEGQMMARNVEVFIVVQVWPTSH